jgi:hypothetical protein
VHLSNDLLNIDSKVKAKFRKNTLISNKQKAEAETVYNELLEYIHTRYDPLRPDDPTRC